MIDIYAGPGYIQFYSS